jgi:hypothetical protein
MSLILEALRKLEKEKAAPERGFLVVGTSTVPARRGTWRLSVLIFAGIAVAAIAWKALSPPASQVSRTPETALPRPSAVTIPAPQLGTTIPAPVVGATSEQKPGGESFLVPVVAPTARSAETRTRAAPSPSPSPTPTYQLQAISSRDGKRVAILNGRLVHEGDSFDDLRVMRIGDMDIEVEVGGVLQTLRFFVD